MRYSDAASLWAALHISTGTSELFSNISGSPGTPAQAGSSDRGAYAGEAASFPMCFNVASLGALLEFRNEQGIVASLPFHELKPAQEVCRDTGVARSLARPLCITHGSCSGSGRECLELNSLCWPSVEACMESSLSKSISSGVPLPRRSFLISGRLRGGI